MLVKLLGTMDILAGIIFLFGVSGYMPYQISLFFGLVLIAKSTLGFLRDFASWIDFVCGIILILTILPFGIPKFVGIILGILLIQKGIVSYI